MIGHDRIQPLDAVLDTIQDAARGGNMLAYYVYAIARRKASSSGLPLDIAGIDPQSRVYTLACGDLLAVVSTVPLAEFQPAALKQHLADHGWLRARAVAHQAVLAELLIDYTAVPLKFCTLYVSEERILDMLKTDRDTLGSVLDRLSGATEWGVKIFCDRQQLIDWATNQSDELRPLRTTISKLSAGASYMLRKQIALKAQQLAESLEHTHAQAMHEQLTAVVRAALSQPTQAADLHGQKGEMVLNGAYLVDHHQQLRFEAELAQLQTVYATMGFRCELTGPWPSYSFAVVEEEA